MSDEKTIDELERAASVLRRCGVKARSTLWRWVRAGKFPAPVQLSSQNIAWRRSDVNAWIAARPPVAWAPHRGEAG